jgi:radical SAM superfamily enzyme YgiQ (UPF0313 family)
MRVLFVPIVLNTLKNIDLEIPKLAPLGVLSVIAYCEKYSNKKSYFSVLDIDEEDKTPKQKLTDRINEFKPDIVAFSAMFNENCPLIFDLAEIAKQINHNLFVVAGGVAISDTYDLFFDYTKNIDAICFGEGELPFKALLDSDNLYDLVSTHESWLTPEAVKNGKKPTPQLVSDLDTIPPINYDYISIEKYIFKERSYYDEVAPAFSLQSSRGCPYRCTFCSVSHKSGKKVRLFSTEQIISDIKFLIEKYNVRVIAFVDDQFFLERERAIQILRAIVDLGIKVVFGNGVTVSLVNDEIAYWIAKAGCKHIPLPIESGSERLLREVIKKPLKLSQVKPALDILRKYNIAVSATFIFGFPGETPEDRKITEEFIKEMGFNWMRFYIATPLKGTELYDICVKNKYIDENEIVFEKKNVSNPEKGMITALHVDPKEIVKYAYQVNLKFNFIENYDYKIGNYERAYNLFKKISSMYPFHAISHYMLAKTCYKMGKNEEGDKYKNMFLDIVNTQSEWKDHAEYLGISISDIDITPIVL